MTRATPPREPTSHLEIDGGRVAVHVRLNARARNYVIRLDPRSGQVVVVRPARGSVKRALSFAHEHRAWIAARRQERPSPIPFNEGRIIPVRGVPHIICNQTSARRGVWVEAAESQAGTARLCVSGQAEHCARRLADWLKRQARTDLTISAARHAQALGLPKGRIQVRDPFSRWGSCSSTGTLSFSWRLILAPPFILDYVAAHETAHLKHLNHGKQFWTLVDRLTPQRATAEDWLSTQGTDLHRYG